MAEIYNRTDREKVETLIVVPFHIPFHQLVPLVQQRSDAYFLVNRLGGYGELEHVVFHLMMQYRYQVPMTIPRYDPQDSWPWREETRYPHTIPVAFPSWTLWSDMDARQLSVLSSGLGWDFYQVEWLLQKWESALGLFDDDILCLSMPVYPMDLYNERVPPDVICREMERFRGLYGEKKMSQQFFALDLLTRDDLGKQLLGFWNRCRGSETPLQLFEWLWEIYESLPVDHDYRPFLLTKNYAVLDVHRKMTFKPCMLISQYLSYHGMYVSGDFFRLYRQDITKGFVAHRKELHLFSLLPMTWSTPQWEAWLDDEMERLYRHVGDHVQWIGKWHLETFLGDSTLWRALLAVWDVIPRRNIFLWEHSSFRYNEVQLRIGHEFRVLMDAKTVRSMNKTQKKNFDNIFCKKK